MDKKNLTIIGLIILILISIGGFTFYLKKQQDMFQETLRVMEAKSGTSDGKKNQDPYKDGPVANTLTKIAPTIQGCYNQYLLANPKKIEGFVKLDWTILPDGKVKQAELISSDLEQEKISPCILSTISQLQFPSPPTKGEVYTTYTYHFKKTN